MITSSSTLAKDSEKVCPCPKGLFTITIGKLKIAKFILYIDQYYLLFEHNPHMGISKKLMV